MGGEVQLLPWRDTVADVGVLQPILLRSDAAAVVLPPELLAKLLPLAKGKPVLQAVSGRQPTGHTITLPDGRQEPEFAFVHRCWQQVLRMDVVTRQL
jgi:hypothetical protein